MSGSRLTVFERSVIERGLAQKLSHEAIGRLIGRHRTTVTREVMRNRGARLARPCKAKVGAGPRQGRPASYRAAVAQERAARRARRPKPYKLTGMLAMVVAGLLEADWSPQQIAAGLPRLFPDDDGMWVSHETIYQALFVSGA